MSTSASRRYAMDFNIPASELRWRFGPSGGPGGQHANRSSTRAELTFDVEKSRAFDDAVRERIAAKIGPEVRITEDRSRSQATNRKRAVARLQAILAEASKPDPPPRRRTRPSRAARMRRLDAKAARGATKQHRRKPIPDE